MSKKSSTSVTQNVPTAALAPITSDAAGIDIGSAEHYVAVPADRDSQPVRRFSCFTGDLYRMADWLKECRITTVAMESTGVYWIPVFQILETRGFTVKLVNARHVKNVPGRKTDIKDCQWLQQLHSYGLLSGSFRPEDQICVLRSYIRHRDNLVRSAAAHIQRMQKALIQMNLQLHKVISDINGVTGMAIIEAILRGERDPLTLAKLKDYRIKNSCEVIAQALQGDYREEHLFVLQQELALYKTYQTQILDCDQQIELCLSRFDTKRPSDQKPLGPSKSSHKKPQRNEPHFDLRGHLYRVTGVDLTRINGFNTLTVQTLLSEIGQDMTRWPTEKHFASWLGLCPNHRITGGQIKSRHTRKVVNRAADAFRLSAQALHHSKSALGAYYRRMSARLGAPAAITATAHKLARIFYRIMKYGEAFVDLGVKAYEEKYREQIVLNLQKKAQEFGYQLTPAQSLPGTVT